MGTLQKYFSYECRLVCGLPSVTLLGTKRDWEEMLNRLEKLKGYGKEPTIWHSLLKSVSKRFVLTFDDPKSDSVLDFWQRIVQRSGGGSGVTSISGWISAFYFWNEHGNLLYRDPGRKTAQHGKLAYRQTRRKDDGT